MTIYIYKDIIVFMNNMCVLVCNLATLVAEVGIEEVPLPNGQSTDRYASQMIRIAANVCSCSLYDSMRGNAMHDQVT